MSNINVLWVDDKPFPELEKRAKKNNITLERAKNSTIGKDALHENLLKWDFVLLDGRGTKEGSVEDLKGCGEMLAELKRLEPIRHIPCCIFSAYAEEQDLKILKDLYGDVKVFSKIEDEDALHPYKELFKYINEEALKLENHQVRCLYADVFSAAEKIELPQEHINSLTDFLKALTFEKFRTACPGGNNLRQIIECICKKLINLNLIPQECLKADKNGNKTNDVNLTDAVGYLGGAKTAFILSKRVNFGILDAEGPIICQFLEDNLQKSLNFTQKDSHDNTPIDQQDESIIIDINKSITEYYDSVPNPLYIFSAVLIVCDFIKAIAEYIDTHADKDENLKRQYHFEEDLIITKETGIEYGKGIVQKDENGIFHIGKHLAIIPQKPSKWTTSSITEGCEVSIKSITKKQQGKYKYSTTDYKILQ